MDSLLALLHDPAIIFTIALTAKTMAFALVLHAAAGVILGYLLATRKGVLIGITDFVVTLPLVFPPVGTGFLLLLLLGRNGPLVRTGICPDLIFTEAAVVIAAFVAGMPLVIKPVQSAIEREVVKLVEAARTLGKSELQCFFLVVIPSVKRSLGAGLILAAGRILGEVGITLMIGGNIAGKTNTISLEIFNAVMDADFTRAGILCSLIGIVSLVIFFVLKKMAAL